MQFQQILHDDEAMLLEYRKGRLLPERCVLARHAVLLHLQGRRWRRQGRPCNSSGLGVVEVGQHERQAARQRTGRRGLAAEQSHKELRPLESSAEVLVVRFVFPRPGGDVVLLGVDDDAHADLREAELPLPRRERPEDRRRVLPPALLVAVGVRRLDPRRAVVLAEAAGEVGELLHHAFSPLRRQVVQVGLAVAMHAAQADAGDLRHPAGREQLAARVRAGGEAEEAHAVDVHSRSPDEGLGPGGDEVRGLRAELACNPSPVAIVVDEPPPSRLAVRCDDDERLGSSGRPLLVLPEDRVARVHA
mmetsp:Transcript_51673/g.156996  ORF Transcript_51673/g.156996 Transcript_51673/m.156996 type:complete len:304 (+) Transcript_51673:130-1041(+)